MALLVRILGPLLGRELLRLARGRALRAAMLLAPTVLLVALLTSDDPIVFRREPGFQSRWAAGVASGCFILAGALIALLLPLTVGPTLLKERQAGGIELLLTTQVSRREIMLGVSGGAAVLALAVLLSLAPVLSILALMGGVDPAALLGALLMLAVEILCFTAAGLQSGVATRTPVGAMALGLVLGCLWFFVFGTTFHLMCIQHVFEGSLRLRLEHSFGWLIVFLAFGAIVLLFLFVLRTFAKDLKDLRMDASLSFQPVLAEAWRDANQTPRKASLWTPLRLAEGDPYISAKDRGLLWMMFVLLGMPFWIVFYFAAPDVGPAGGMLTPIWFVVQFFVVAIAVTNPLVARRPGFFEDLLTTPLGGPELLRGIVATSLPSLRLAMFMPLVFAWLWFTANPFGILIATLIALAWMFDLLLVGVILSLLPATNFGVRLVVTASVALFASIGINAFGRISHSIGDAVSLAAFGSLFVAWFASKRRPNSKNLALFVVALNLGMLTNFGALAAKLHENDVTSHWSWASPFSWMWFALSEAPRMQTYGWPALAALPYLGGLLLCDVLLWHFAAKRFDELVGRTHPRRADEHRPS